MHPRSLPVQLRILIPAPDYGVYLAAVRRLRRIMGHKAPDVPTLIQSNLQGRDALGLADDYLDSIGWPYAKRRKHALRRFGRRTSPLPPATSAKKRVGRPVSEHGRPPIDPSRN